MRILRFLSAFFGALITILIALCATLIFLAATGRNIEATRWLVAQAGRLIDGQQTHHMRLDVRIEPAARQIGGTAVLDVRASSSTREYLFFLLGTGLNLESCWEELASGTHNVISPLRLGPLVIVPVGRQVARGESIRLGFEYAGQPVGKSIAASRGVFEPSEVMLSVDQLWYPADLQSFFDAEVRVTLPARLNLLHNGTETDRTPLGEAVRVGWTTIRPVQALSLVAGTYTQSTPADGDSAVRVFLGPDVDLDAVRIAGGGVRDRSFLTEKYGPSGFPTSTIFVTRRIERAFNDGTGMIGIPPRYFTGGDYGSVVVAHEIAHDWWGATVAERWLDPGTGGEWIVEGFAEFSSWMATRAAFGERGLLRVVESAQFDPARVRSVGEMSVVDNGLDPLSRQTIYNRGGSVTRLLHREVGDEVFFDAARKLIDRYRYSAATDHDVEAIFSAVAGKDLGGFFRTWVRSAETPDLTLEPNEGGARLRYHAETPLTGPVQVLATSASGDAQTQPVGFDGSIPLGTSTRLVADPLLEIPDPNRSNNVIPRRMNPRSVATSARGDRMIVYGEPFPWSTATIVHLDSAGKKQHDWNFDRGLVAAPTWSADGTRILVAERDDRERLTIIGLNTSDGKQRTAARVDFNPREYVGVTANAAETILADRTRLRRFRDGRPTDLLDRPDHVLGSPSASPDGLLVAYSDTRGPAMDLRVVGVDGSNDRVLLAWNRGTVRWQWAPDSAVVFAVVAGDWDWQLWEIPLDGKAPRALVRQAAAITGVAVSADGERLAFIAAADLDFGAERREVFVMTRATGEVQRFDLDGRNAHSLAWLDPGALLLVTSNPLPVVSPAERSLQVLDTTSGTLRDFKGDSPTL